MDEQMETITVWKRLMPAGATLVEAYETATEIIVMGDPPDEDDDPVMSYPHSCDWMGCGSVGPHVIYRFDKPSSTVKQG